MSSHELSRVFVQALRGLKSSTNKGDCKSNQIKSNQTKPYDITRCFCLVSERGKLDDPQLIKEQCSQVVCAQELKFSDPESS